MTAKRFVTRLTALTLCLSVTFLSSCSPKKIDINEYPEPVTTEETVKESATAQTTETTTDPDIRGGMTDSQFEEFIAIPDPFEATGKFQFYPKAIPEFYARQYRDNPKIIYVAKEMLNAIYTGETEFDIPPEFEMGYEDLYETQKIAEMSCPLASACRCGFSDEEPLHYYVTYLPKDRLVLTEDGEINEAESSFTSLEKDEAMIIINSFTDYIQDLINSNVSAEDSDMVKAEKIYEALVKDMSFRERLASEDTSYISFEDDMTYETPPSMLEDIVNEKTTTQPRLALLYQYILTQLNIECMTVFSSGAYTKQGIERLDTVMGEDGRDIWNVVVVDGKAYNCDLAYEILTYEYDKSLKSDAEPEMRYFGMSDKTRGESFKVTDRDNLVLYNPDEWDLVYGTPKKGLVPECPNDYYE